MVALVAIAWGVLAVAAPAAPALRVLSTAKTGTPILLNGSFAEGEGVQAPPWRPWGEGFRVAAREGRAGSRAMVCERAEGGREYGASQTIVLNRTQVAPFVIRGWSKAEGVSGSPDNGYSLYIDIVYADGTPLWGRTTSFRCGTHDWEHREFLVAPEKPVRSITLHCLFRGHTGKVWFDDISLEEIATPAGAVLVHGIPVEPGKPTRPGSGKPAKTYATQDGLQLSLRDGQVAGVRVGTTDLAAEAPSGFLVRDFAAGSDFFEFNQGTCESLGLRLQSQVTAASNHIAIEGQIIDTTGKDRAVTLLFALPIDAREWQWGDDMRQSRKIEGVSEFAHTVPVGAGAAGRISRYPLGAIWNDHAGVGLGLDMAHPAQYSIVYHPGTRQFYLAYDVALVKETVLFPSGAGFRFVLFQFEPRWGFRAALQKYYDVFPKAFVKRVQKEGTWMPFTDIARVPGWQDFGFAFQEGAPNVRFDDTNGIASFLYVEPMSYWIPLPAAVPRDYDSALKVLREDAEGKRGPEQKRMAAATLTSGVHTSDGQFALYLVKAPWCDGGVYTLSPDPEIATNAAAPHNKASVMKASIDAAFTKHPPDTSKFPPSAGLDGLYYDSLEMSAAMLNYRRDHFRTTAAPLVYDFDGRPCQLMIFNTWKFVRETATELHARRRLTFANSVLWNYSFPAPLLDVMGTEVNWLHAGTYAPDTDTVMNFRRALCRQKPYCLLLNTDYEKFTVPLMERFFERCLFYGVWPGFFDQEAASKDPYWASSNKWYERDRALFQKYIPLFQRITSAGWEPIPLATADNRDLWLERFGLASEKSLYLTVFNATEKTQTGRVRLDPALVGGFTRPPVDLVSGQRLKGTEQGLEIQLGPHRVAVLHLER